MLLGKPTPEIKLGIVRSRTFYRSDDQPNQQRQSTKTTKTTKTMTTIIARRCSWECISLPSEFLQTPSFRKILKGSCLECPRKLCTSNLKFAGLTILNWSDWPVRCIHTDRQTDRQTELHQMKTVSLPFKKVTQISLLQSNSKRQLQCSEVSYTWRKVCYGSDEVIVNGRCPFLHRLPAIRRRPWRWYEILPLRLRRLQVLRRRFITISPLFIITINMKILVLINTTKHRSNYTALCRVHCIPPQTSAATWRIAVKY